MDDYADEKKEVISKQGASFPYSKGMWLICQLVAAINPHDLDALDEHLPLSKFTLDNILGRKTSSQEYQYYFQHCPASAQYQQWYPRLLTEETFTKAILSSNSPHQAYSAMAQSNFNPGLWQGSANPSQNQQAQYMTYAPPESFGYKR